MKTKSPQRSAFFNLQGIIAVVGLLTGIFIALFATAGPWEAAPQAGAQVRGPNTSPFAPSDTVQQAWVARYNGPGNGRDLATAMAIDNSGNIYVTGASSGSHTDLDYATIKYNSAGQRQWVARYNGATNSVDVPFAIALDGSGNVYVTGGAGDDYATIRYTSAGQRQWVGIYHGGGGKAIAVDGSGNVYVTGDSPALGGGNTDYLTIKYNWAGQEQWVARYDYSEMLPRPLLLTGRATYM
jgi:Beta-propeller repeat